MRDVEDAEQNNKKLFTCCINKDRKGVVLIFKRQIDLWMNQKYFKQTNPFVVPTTDGKVIKEHFRLASMQAGNYSVAHMIAPPGWSEPYQTPEFDEITFVVRGRKRIIIAEKEEIILSAGESLLTKKGCRIQYSNPFEEETEYLSICLPAFSIDLVNREE